MGGISFKAFWNSHMATVFKMTPFFVTKVENSIYFKALPLCPDMTTIDPVVRLQTLLQKFVLMSHQSSALKEIPTGSDILD